MTDRYALSQTFLAGTRWASAERRFLAGDASDRSYDRLMLNGQTAVLMDAPPGKGDDTTAFAVIARHLAAIGLSSPRILAEDHASGFLLLEDLGDALFARLLQSDPTQEIPLYSAATDVLVHLQSHPAPKGLPDLSARDWAEAASFALSWYTFATSGQTPDSALFETILTRLLQSHANGHRTLTLRDYHAENLLWLPDRQGYARVGLLDFQLAQMGQPGYDLVSLLQDARRDVAPETEAMMIVRFCAAKGIDPGTFAPAYSILGAQRALRILGIFARLCLKGGKPAYISLIPRVWGQLHRNLAHPALAPLAALCADLLPEPSPEALCRITAQCGHHPHR